MPDDELTRRFAALSERVLPLVEEPAVGAIERRGRRQRRARRVGALLTAAAVVLGAYLLATVMRQGWPAGDLDQGPVAPAPAPSSGPAATLPPTTDPQPTTPTTNPAPTTATTRPEPTSTAPSTSSTVPVRGLRILEPLPGTVVHPGQRVRMRAVGCPPNGEVRFEDGTTLLARDDGSFTAEFEIPPGPTGDFFLDATCGGVTRTVKLRRSP